MEADHPQRILVQLHPMPKIINNDPYQFILHHVIEHQGMINALGFKKEISDNLVFPSWCQITPVLNPRQP